MAKIKITLSDVFKKDLKVLAFLLINGGAAFISFKFLNENPELSLIIGAALNYLTYRVTQELEGLGYKKALEK